MSNKRGQMRESEGKKKKVMAALLFRACALAPPGIPEHSVKVLHFKINHSWTKSERHVLTFMHTKRSHVILDVLCPCPAWTRQPQHVETLRSQFAVM